MATVATLLVAGPVRLDGARPHRSRCSAGSATPPTATTSPASSTGAASRTCSTPSSSAPGAPTRTLSLIVGDLDRFKRVNDAHGHAAGDEVLTRVAGAIAGAKRGFDSAARVGGEEFAVLAPDCDEHGAFMLAERIRRR